MGADIHSMVEFQYAHSQNEWYALTDPIFDNAGYRGEPLGMNRPLPYRVEPVTSRNYTLFSKLADVRNGSMFGLSRDRVTPLDSPRGVPKDASKEWRRYVKQWGPDLHSTSYFTLEELEQFKADAKFADVLTRRGYLTGRDYLKLRRNGTEPESWSGGVGGGSLKVYEIPEASAMSIEDIEKIVAEDYHSDSPFAKHYFGAGWTSLLEDDYQELFDAMERMRSYFIDNGPIVSPSDVRIVFGFDN